MKKLLLSCHLIMAMFFGAFAQTNLDFETWTGNEPSGWITYNFLTQLGAAQSTFKETTDPAEGTASVKMVTVNCAACPNFGLPTTLGGAVVNGVIGQPPALGSSYTGRPVSIDFQYKSNPVAGDAGVVFVQLSRWDAGTSQQVAIGQGYFLSDTPVSAWTSVNLPIQYANADIPDTIMILSSSSAASAVQGLPGAGTPAVGSEFFVDSIVINDPCVTSGLSAAVTGTNETIAGANDGTASVTATGGTPAYTYSWSNGATSQTVSGLAPGTYTVVVLDNNSCAATGTYTVLAGAAGIRSDDKQFVFSVYPVPAKNTVFFSLGTETAGEISIFDITGKNIICHKIKENPTAISVEKIPAGIYFYQLKNENSELNETGKISVIK